MYQGRLIKMLTTLAPGEFRQFVTYVKSPYFNSNEKLIKLVTYLQKVYPDFAEKKLTHKTLFETMYGKVETLNEQQIHDQLSQLLRLLENFFTQLNFESDTGGKYTYLLQALRSRNLPKHFYRVYSRAEEQLLSGTPITDSYLHLHRIEQQAEAFSGKFENRSANQLLQDQITHLDIYFLSVKLRSTCEMLNRRNIINTDYQSEMDKEIYTYLLNGNSPYLKIPFVSIYFHIYLTLIEPENENHYQNLAIRLREHVGKLPPSEVYTLYAFAQNYCIKQINRGNPQYLHELFMLYQQLLDEGILVDSGYLAHEHYKNITTVGLRLKAFDWVAGFLETYREKLHPEFRSNAYNYNLCVFYYEKGQYREAMKLLQQVDFSDLYYHLGAKSVLLKIYFELRDDDSLKYHILAFKAFLKRNRRISSFHYEGHLNLLQMVSRVARVRRMKPRLDAEVFELRRKELLENIRAAGNIPNASWLKQQTETL
ncbi:MAG: hypothetical protein SF052_06395 [Bacteroidia bacterium]|nr:hypothetical protein [Bacteroidia bacterium]